MANSKQTWKLPKERRLEDNFSTEVVSRILTLAPQAKKQNRPFFDVVLLAIEGLVNPRYLGERPKSIPQFLQILEDVLSDRANGHVRCEASRENLRHQALRHGDIAIAQRTFEEHLRRIVEMMMEQERWDRKEKRDRRRGCCRVCPGRIKEGIRTRYLKVRKRDDEDEEKLEPWVGHRPPQTRPHEFQYFLRY